MELMKRISWATVLLHVGLIAVGFIGALVLFAFTGQIRLGKEAPAWVQAVFSVVAIGAAVAVPWWQHRKAAQLRAEQAEAQAAGRAAAVLADVRELNSRIERIKQYIKLANRDHDFVQVGFPAVPQGLIEQAGLLPELGPTGTSLLRAIGRCWEARDLTKSEGYVRREKIDEFIGHVSHAEVHAAAALASIRKLLN